MSDNPIKVLLVDDHPLVLDGISARLEDEAGIDVVGAACNGTANEASRIMTIDVCFMTITLGYS